MTDLNQLDIFQRNENQHLRQCAVKCRFSTVGINRKKLGDISFGLTRMEKSLFFRIVTCYNSIYKLADADLIEDFENYDHNKISGQFTAVLHMILNCKKDIILLKLTSLQKIKLEK